MALGCLATMAFGEPPSVVINEIMYHPPGDLEQLQFIELFNAGESDADLSGWTFSKGVKFDFPAKTTLRAGGYCVVCRDRKAFARQYGADTAVLGEFVGHLSHGGERVELSDRDKEVVDFVKYADAAPWPMAADGHSASLERICPFAPGQHASNWNASKLPEMETPAGTPGRRNDSFLAKLPPAIGEITLTPDRPAPDQPVAVEAEVRDAEGVKSVEIAFQIATENRLGDVQTRPMERVSGDARRGFYRATLPAQPEERLVRYRIQAAGGAGAIRTSPPQNDLRGAWSYSTFLNHNDAKIPFALVLHPRSTAAPTNPRVVQSGMNGIPIISPKPTRGRDAFIYVPPDGGAVETFDYVQAPARKGGYKVHFLKDQTLRGMTGINIIFESQPRFVLAEALSYEIYRLAGTPAELNEHVRLWVDGTPRGYHLLIEQPNKAFLARNDRETSGNLYKYFWYGNGLVGRHEKKTNVNGNHDDLQEVITGLNRKDPKAQWAFIEEHFNVEEFINYYAVNMCIQNWDGFHNNYFVYHDTGNTGRWEIYPWDEDKTIGDYDGASQKYDWYEMPLDYGSSRSVRPAQFGGPTTMDSFEGWWRQPGYFSRPLLSNPQFRARFLQRLREVCETVFTEEKIFPLIDAMRDRLEAEVPIRARLVNDDPVRLAGRFHVHIQSLHDQVVNRRKFILDELEKHQR